MVIHLPTSWRSHPSWREPVRPLRRSPLPPPADAPDRHLRLCHRSFPGSGKQVVNSAALLRNGAVEFVQSKRLLPFYDVFDEQRYFAPAESQNLYTLTDQRLALTICEDAWNDKLFWPRRLYSVDPIEELMRGGGSLILNISASPYYRGKRELRHRMLAAIATRHQASVVMVNQVGGNDSLVFDGASFALGPMAQSSPRRAPLLKTWSISTAPRSPAIAGRSIPDEDAAVYQALVLGTRDYVRKCGFSKVLVGLSGGVDSALVAAIAVDALGKENVTTIGMPSQYSSAGSIEDARALAENLGIRYTTIAIHDLFEQYTKRWRRSSPAGSRTSPRKTSSRASAAIC